MSLLPQRLIAFSLTAIGSLARRGALLALALGASSAVSSAQQSTVDEGTLLVSHRGTAAGRESFRIQQAQETGRLYLAKAEIVYGDRRLQPSLTADEHGRALLYQAVESQGSRRSEELRATARPGRLSVVRKTAQGESSKEYVVGQGAVVLDEGVFHQYALLALTHRAGAVTVVVPSSGQQLSGRLEERGVESITVDGQQLSATRWSLALPDGAHDVWVDARGRLLRVAIPAKGIVAVRDERPR